MIKKNIVTVMLVLCISTFFMSLTAFAYTSGEEQASLNVDAAWIEGEMMKIDVTNINTGKKQNLEVSLKNCTNDDEYISIQAVDLDGNKSNVVKVKNPYYKNSNSGSNEITSSSASVPFTPNGNGEVMDNAKDTDGKEFFTIKTRDENVFYLIVDRQRGSENVYLLNAVSDKDLMALAEKSGSNTTEEVTIANTTEKTEITTETIASSSNSNNNTGTFVLIAIAMLIVGGIGYYFKIYKPKHLEKDIDSEDEADIDTEYSEYETESDEEIVLDEEKPEE